jgi:hypothetical protein
MSTQARYYGYPSKKRALDALVAVKIQWLNSSAEKIAERVRFLALRPQASDGSQVIKAWIACAEPP